MRQLAFLLLFLTSWPLFASEQSYFTPADIERYINHFQVIEKIKATYQQQLSLPEAESVEKSIANAKETLRLMRLAETQAIEIGFESFIQLLTLDSFIAIGLTQLTSLDDVMTNNMMRRIAANSQHHKKMLDFYDMLKPYRTQLRQLTHVSIDNDTGDSDTRPRE